MWVALLGLVPLLATLELRAERQRRRPQVYLWKPLTTLCIGVTAAVAPTPVSPVYQAAIVLGLLCSLAGDVFLMLPRDRFTPGLFSFLLAHLCYIAAFGVLAGPPRTPFVAFLLGAYGAYLLRRLWPRLGRYRLPVAAYAVVLLFMLATAYTQLANDVSLRTTLAFGGAVLFAASDSVLALDRFEAGEQRRQQLVLSTYFAAQFLIAASVSRVWG